jgi:hypothetical protein
MPVLYELPNGDRPITDCGCVVRPRPDLGCPLLRGRERERTAASGRKPGEARRRFLNGTLRHADVVDAGQSCPARSARAGTACCVVVQGAGVICAEVCVCIAGKAAGAGGTGGGGVGDGGGTSCTGYSASVGGGIGHARRCNRSPTFAEAWRITNPVAHQGSTALGHIAGGIAIRRGLRRRARYAGCTAGCR